MAFNDIDINFSYRSHKDNILEDFYIPVLSNSIKYDRAVGYFSNKLLNYLGKSIYPFIKNNGKMRLIFGISMSTRDIEEINKGYQLRNIVKQKITKEIDKLKIEYLDANLSNICWMIAEGFLDIKIVAKTERASGIYHEKFSIFEDKKSNKIAISGSINETDNAMKINFEYFDVYKSWEGISDSKRIEEKELYFEQLWNNKTNGLEILDFPVAAKNKLIKIAPSQPINNFNNKNKIKRSINFNTKIQPRDYQKKAIKQWIENKYKGILEMATGTGKTYTALLALQKYLSNNDNKNAILIYCPYTHLIDQWEESIYDIYSKNVIIIKCFGGKSKWYKNLNTALQKLLLDKNKMIFILTTISTGSKELFINILNSDKINKILICDEVHNAGANQAQEFMNIKADARLGLSATPIRKYDEEGNEKIREYFGESIYKFGLKKAIDRGFLSKYNYKINLCNLNEDEYNDYRKYSKQIAVLYSKSKNKINEEKLLNLLIKRSKILASCENKLDIFDNLLKKIHDHSNLIVYTAEIPEYFDKTLNILNKNDIVCLKIVAKVTNKDRIKIIKKFSKGDVECLLAMRCLDEGVDIPNANKAIILSSSTNYKQYVQRRGRVLRKSKNNSKDEVADIYDFLVLPLKFEYKSDKNLFERELKRVLEFASIAENKTEIINDLFRFSENHNLLKQFTNIFTEVL